MHQDLNITLGGHRQAASASAASAGTSQATPRVVNPYLDAPVAREAGGIRQMQGRQPVALANSESSLGGQSHGQPRPAPGASTKIQVDTWPFFSSFCCQYMDHIFVVVVWLTMRSTTLDPYRHSPRNYESELESRRPNFTALCR